MAIQQRKQTDIILTFQVLQFVNQLRRRVKPRRLDGSTTPVLGTTQVSHQSLRALNGLSGISVHHGKQLGATNRVSKRISKRASKLLKQTPGSDVAVTPNVSGDEVQHMLSSVDTKLSPSGSKFSSIASSNKLFLKHRNSPIVEGSSLNQTVQLLVTVQDCIDVLSECRCAYDDDWLLAQGKDVGLIMDENFIANYDHMLQCLRAELIDALARKALEELLQGGHDKTQRKMLGWFTEFAGEARPLSSSFPWTIKPSLAVLWGVCWMFYDNNPDELDQAIKGGNDRVRQARVLQALDFNWNAPASSDYLNLGFELIGTPPQVPQQQPRAERQTLDTSSVGLQARNTDPWESDLSGRLPSIAVSQAAAPHSGRSTYYHHIALDQTPISPTNSFLPPFDPEPLTVYPHLGSESNYNTWHSPYTSLPQHRSPRHLINSPQTPGIRVTGTQGNDVFTQPQLGFASPNSIYPYSRQPQASPLNLNTTFNYQQQYMMGSNLSPDTSTMQVPQIPIKHERTSSINSNSNIPTPVSMSGPRSPLLSPTSVDNRSHLVASPRNHSRQPSTDSSEAEVDEDGTLRKNHSYKRAEEPPRNQDGKMICRHAECTGLLFERKCEWSKHMDKHDRPYKCTVKGCEKLQGFTYSGGLLRHEREVHKMHGGTKKSLFCPFTDCKRSSGAGFTRKENLAEHIRRVHRRTSMSADMHGLVIRRDIMESSPIAESRRPSESPYTRPMEFREEDEINLKRKRGSESNLSDRGNDEMRAEIKRLRQENEEKDSRLRQLEQAVMALQQNHR